MDIEVWKVVISGLALLANVISFGAGWFAWRVGRQQLRKEEVDGKIGRVHQRLDGIKDGQSDTRDRVSRMEKHLEEMPTAQAVHRLALSISDMGGELKKVMTGMENLKGLVERQERATGRLEDYVRLVETSRRQGSAS